MGPVTSPLLITAFSAFPGVDENPTQVLLDSLGSHEDPLLAAARKLLLPTLYDVAPAQLAAALDPMPRVIVMTGYSAKARGLVLERRSSNRCLPDRPDASGNCARQLEVGTSVLATRVDVAALLGTLRTEGIAAEVSEDAGGYVCNHVYHAALAGPCVHENGPLAIFVHVPALPGTPLARTAAGTMPLGTIQAGLSAIARSLLWQAPAH